MMERRYVLGAALTVPVGLAAGVGSVVVPGAAQAAERGRYRHRRGRHRVGLLVRDVEGTAVLGRRSGGFEGDCLIQGFHYGRTLHVAGILDGEADLEGRRFDFELNIDGERFRRVGAGLAERRGRVSLDVGEIELGRRLEVDLDAVRLDDIRGAWGDRLERLLAKLAEALADADGYRKGHGDGDVDGLIEEINQLLAKALFVVDAGWRRRHAA